MATSLLLGMTTWFSANAVGPQIIAKVGASAEGEAWLALAVQLGFVIGALALAAVSAADRFGPRQLMAGGALVAGLANAYLLIATGPTDAFFARFLTGASLAAVYPPAMKAIATWFQSSRSLALSIVIGALTIGSASPHLAAAAGNLDLGFVVGTTSVLSWIGAVVILLASDGPYAFPRSRFSWREAMRALTRRRVMLISVGYLGHMWELYAMWTWFVVFYTAVLHSDVLHSDVLHADVTDSIAASASVVTFLVIAIGALGCYVAGRMAVRFGSLRVAAIATVVSGTCAATIGWVSGAPLWLITCIGLIWGFSVIADSALYSSMVTRLADERYVGSALTVQMAFGYLVTTPAVWLLPRIEASLGYGAAFTVLALGSGVTLAAMGLLARTRPAPRDADYSKG